MQSKVFGGLFFALWGGIFYQAGKISQKQKKNDYSFKKIEIQVPTNNIDGQQSQVSQKLNSSTEVVSQQTDTFSDNLILPSIRRINYPNFKIIYSTYHKCPLAVHQKVSKQLADGDAPRRSTFFEQPTLQYQFRSTNDHFTKSSAYKNFYFARGHMAAAGNYSGNKDAKFQTFTYANVIPQNQYNNAGIWNTFERYSRDLVMDGKCDNVQIISGPIFYKNNPYVNDKGQNLQKVFKSEQIILLQNGISTPQKLYKIIKCNKKSQYYIDGFEFWNKATYDNEKQLSNFRTSIKSIENQTGLIFNFDKFTHKQIGTLFQLDQQGLTKSKKYYDETFYTNLMKKSKTIEDLNNSFYRAKEQKISINLDNFSEQSQNLFNKEIHSINSTFQSNPEGTACRTLKDLMKLNKNLFYLHQLKNNFSQKIQQSQVQPIQKCKLKMNDLRTKNWQDFSNSKENEEQKEPINKSEKIALNSMTFALSKSMEKQEAVQSRLKNQEEVKKTTLSYINEEKLRDFIIPVNLATTLAENKKQGQI